MRCAPGSEIHANAQAAAYRNDGALEKRACVVAKFPKGDWRRSARRTALEILHRLDFGACYPSPVRRNSRIKIISGAFTDSLARSSRSRNSKNLHRVVFQSAVVKRLSIRRPVNSPIRFRSVG